MKTHTKYALVGGISAGFGFVVGAVFNQKYMEHQIKRNIPIVKNIMTNLLKKALDEDLSTEEIIELANVEMEFMNIVNKTK